MKHATALVWSCGAARPPQLIHESQPSASTSIHRHRHLPTISTQAKKYNILQDSYLINI